LKSVEVKPGSTESILVVGKAAAYRMVSMLRAAFDDA
jgi:hypothetical protein